MAIKEREQVMMENITKVVEERIREATKGFVGDKNRKRTHDEISELIKQILLECNNGGEDFIVDMENGDKIKLAGVESMYDEESGKVSLHYHWRGL